jgi:glycosyltransferase involved in cell wall biosynthesis
VWHDRKISVVLPTYTEVGSIRSCVEGFESLGIVDEIIVVNNNAADGTTQEVSATTALEIHEPIQGYGAAIRRGLAEATGDLVVLCEPDGTFDPADLWKLLPFTHDTDVVLGSRTVQTFIWRGANMGLFLRWGNWAVAKMIEALFGTVYLSDVGCTFRVMQRHVVDGLLPRFQLLGSAFGLELLMRSVVARHRFVQVPVNYRARVGKSAVTGDFRNAFRLGLEMIGLVIRFRLRLGVSSPYALGPDRDRRGLPLDHPPRETIDITEVSGPEPDLASEKLNP